MYDLLIVDDEVTIRKGLSSTLDWNSLGIRVAGLSRHGKEALDFMRQHPVHIVITDLKMPVMDGLELTEQIHLLYPDVKMVILSGYEDFEFAKNALKYNVQDYLLKPFSLKKLTELMASLCSELDLLFTQREHRRINDQLLTDSLFSIRYNYFKRCSETIGEEEEKYLETLGFPVNPSSCYIALCELGDDLNTIAEILDDSRKDKNWVPFLTPDKRLALLTHSEIDRENLLCEISRISDHTVYIGTGSTVNSWVELGRSFTEAMQTFKARPFICGVSLLNFGDLPEWYKKEGKITQDVDKETDESILKLCEHIFQSDLRASLRCLKRISQTLSLSLKDFRVFRQELVKVLVVTAYYLKRQGIELEECISPYSVLLDTTAELQNIHEAERWSRHLVDAFCTKVSESKKITCKPLLKKAMSYMKSRYSKPLRIDEVADYLQISPNYLSRIFKEETELSFLNWLNRYRITQSEELLRDPTIRIYEISEQVGFSDYRYFNKVFKKIKNMSPRDFRNNDLAL